MVLTPMQFIILFLTAGIPIMAIGMVRMAVLQVAAVRR